MAVEEWEINNMTTEHGLTLDENIKVALMTCIVPSDLQDVILQGTDMNIAYISTRDEMLNLARNSAFMSMTTPVEIGHIEHGEWKRMEYKISWNRRG